MKTKFLALLLIAAALPCVSFAQAQWNGIGPQQASQTPLAIHVTDGDLTSILGTFRYSAQTFTLPPNATSYVYLDLTQTPPTIVVNQVGFPTGFTIYTIAIAVTNNVKITQLTDSRPLFNNFLFGGGGGGSGTVGPCTVNFVAKFTAQTVAGCSTITDDGSTPTRAPDGVDSATGGFYAEWIVDTGGVTANKLVCRSSSNKAQICAPGITTGVLGVAQATKTSGQTVEVCFAGKCSVISSNAATSGDWLIPSTSVAGDVDDVGVTKPTNVQTLPAESTVSGGSAVLTTFLSPDTLNASSGGANPSGPCPQWSIADFTAAGTASTVGCINPQSANGNYILNENVVSGVAVASSLTLPGVPVNAQAGTTYTKLYSDRASLDTFNNPNPVAVTIPAAGSTGFTSNYVDANLNLGAGLTTLTPTGPSTINQGSSQILPLNWFGLLYSNNTNYFMPVMPTLAAFPNCIDSGGNHLNFTAATGAISCGNTSNNGLSGMTAGQVAIAGSANTITSSKPLQGTDTNILTSGTVSGTGTPLCTDANGGATTVGCPATATKTCSIVIGAENGTALGNADIGPQDFQCRVDKNGTIIEVAVVADAGTPTALPRKTHLGANTNLLSGALSTAGAGAIACSNTGGTTSINGSTTCTNTLTTTAVVAGDFIGITSGTAGGTAKLMTVHITWTVP